MRVLLAGCAAFLVLLGTAAPVHAQLIPGWQAKQFTLERIDADHLRLVGEVEIVGEGPNAGQQIFADQVDWNLASGELVATGNVLLVSPSARLAAERVLFNTKTGRGTFYTASGMASLAEHGRQDRSLFGTLEPDVYFYGETIEKIGPDRYRISRGGFTTCVQPTPRWEIVSGRVTIDIGDYAVLRHAVLRVKDVPVFYLPVLYYPIQSDDRATGFLLPTYGQSSYRGSSLSNAFFWAIDRSQDLTLLHDWFTRVGQGMGAEYRYAAAPGSEGQIRTYFLNEKEARFEQPGGGTTVTPAHRTYEIGGGMVQALPYGLHARGRVDYFSDITAQQLHHTDIYSASRRQRLMSGALSGAWRAVSTTASYQRSEYFYSATQSFVSGYEPSVVLNVSSQRVGRLPAYFSMTNEASRVLSIDRRDGTEADLSLTRLDMLPSLRVALSTLPFLSVNGYGAFRTTYYSQSLDEDGLQIPQGLTRRYLETRADIVGPVFSRVFTPGNRLADRLKHLVEPNISVQRISSISDQDRIALAGNQHDYVVGGVTRLSYGLTNRVIVRKASSDPSARTSAPRELLAATLSQSYYTDERASQFDTAYQSSYLVREPSKFSPVALSVRAAPTTLSTATVRIEYDHAERAIQGISAMGGVNYPSVQASAGWSTRRYSDTFTDNTLNASTGIRSEDGRLGGNYSMNWDIGRRTLMQQRWTGYYNAQCCGIALEYQQFNYPSVDSRFVLPQDRRFNLSFTLAGIGTFSNFFGAFGGGVGGRY